ncbi:hypothetical protein ACLB2K_053723 [Fragaria x ananassa]
MGEWVVGAFINLFGSIAINFGTNLLKLGHNERERHSMLEGDGTNGKLPLKPIIYFHTWRVGFLFFVLGNCLNFISFGYAAQSLLAALGSIQFVSNIAFAYFVLNKMVTVKVMVATAFIVLGNIFLVAFGNHQSPVFTPEQLAEKFSNITFLLYCLILILIVALHHSIYRRGVLLHAVSGHDLRSYWHMLLPFSYAIVSGAVGSFSVLFAKSLSNLLRLVMSSSYQLHSWFTYSMLLLFLSTAGFWMTRLNEGLSLFDAILIVPMFQIAWTFFSICTGFVYFQEYQVLNTLRTTMFILGMMSVFTGISLLAPDDSKGGDIKDNSSLVSVNIPKEVDRIVVPSEDIQIRDTRSFVQGILMKISEALVKAKTACALSLGFGEDSINASAVLVMPMVSSKITGFRGNGFDRAKIFSMRNSNSGWDKRFLYRADAPCGRKTAADQSDDMRKYYRLTLVRISQSEIGDRSTYCSRQLRQLSVLDFQQDVEDDCMIAFVLSEEYAQLDGAVARRLSNLAPIPHIPRINSYIPNISDASLDHQRLLQRLYVYRLCEVKVSGDGNCQFRALSDQMYKSPDYHKHVRKEIVKQLKDYRSQYEGYVPMRYKHYRKKMAKSGEWGDHVTLQAAADKFEAKICLLTSFRDTCFIEIKPQIQPPKRELWLSFWSEVHYNSLYEIKDAPIQQKPRKKHWLF